MVERNVANVKVASSRLVSRSRFRRFPFAEAAHVGPAAAIGGAGEARGKMR